MESHWKKHNLKNYICCDSGPLSEKDPETMAIKIYMNEEQKKKKRGAPAPRKMVKSTSFTEGNPFQPASMLDQDHHQMLAATASGDISGGPLSMVAASQHFEVVQTSKNPNRMKKFRPLRPHPATSSSYTTIFVISGDENLSKEDKRCKREEQPREGGRRGRERDP